MTTRPDNLLDGAPRVSGLTARRRASQLAGALAHPLRLWILDRLGDNPCCVGDVVHECAAEQSTVSRHLAVLRDAGLVASETRGRQRVYRLESPEMTARVLLDLEQLARPAQA